MVEQGETIEVAFHRAVQARDASRVRSILQESPGARELINAPIFPFDSPAIVSAAGSGNRVLIDTLLEFGADPNARSSWWAGGFHPLHSATGAVADRLIAAGSRMDACAAAHLDRPDELISLLDDDPARVHERGGDGQTPLHFARSREIVDILLARGADPDARDLDHRGTPAQWMLDHGQGRGRYELARYLVERGASADIFLAAALGLTVRARELIEQDPSIRQLRTSEGPYGEMPPSSYHIYTWTIGGGLSPLQVAVQFEQDAVIELLASTATDAERFAIACVRGDARTAEQLLGRDPGLIGRLGPEELRALPDAGWHGNAAAVDLMLRLGFDPAARGQDGGTVLHCGAWQGWAECVETALRHESVRLLIEDRDTCHHATPLGWCFHGSIHRRNPAGDYPAVARLLLGAGARVGSDPGSVPAEVLAAVRESSPDGPRS